MELGRVGIVFKRKNCRKYKSGGKGKGIKLNEYKYFGYLFFKKR